MSQVIFSITYLDGKKEKKDGRRKLILLTLSSNLIGTGLVFIQSQIFPTDPIKQEDGEPDPFDTGG